jgi:serine/threonine protein kinase
MHPNIVEYYGYSISEDRKTISILMELCSDGSLHDLLHNQPLAPLNNLQRIRVLIDFVKALKYIHSTGIIHRDLKPANILIKKQEKGNQQEYSPKLTDFGLSRVVGPSNRKSMMTAVYGTQQYTAPEVLNNEPNTFESDVYSLGVIIWEVFSRRIPYADGPYKSCNLTIPVAIKNVRPDISLLDSTTHIEIIELIKNCWEPNPENRPTLDLIQEILTRIEGSYLNI